MGKAKRRDDSRMKLVLAVVGLAALAVVIGLTSGGSEEHDSDTPDSTDGPMEFATGPVLEHDGPPADDDHAHGAHGRYEEQVIDLGPNARREYFPGKGWAVVVDDPNAETPPPLESLPDNPEPIEPPPEELPQTARWKLGKTEELTEIMRGRVERLEAAVADARAAGDSEQARRLQVRLERTRSRITDLEREVEELGVEAESEPSEEEVVREWEERTGRSVDEVRGGTSPSTMGEPTAAPPPGGP